MDRYFTKTFYKFFFGFVVIITLAVGVLMTANVYLAPEGVDNVASPQ